MKGKRPFPISSSHLRRSSWEGPYEWQPPILGDLVLVRRQGILISAKRKLAKSPEGIDIVKAIYHNRIS